MTADTTTTTNEAQREWPEAQSAACESALGYPSVVHSQPCSWPACELSCEGRKHRLSAVAALTKVPGFQPAAVRGKPTREALAKAMLPLKIITTQPEAAWRDWEDELLHDADIILAAPIWPTAEPTKNERPVPQNFNQHLLSALVPFATYARFMEDKDKFGDFAISLGNGAARLSYEDFIHAIIAVDRAKHMAVAEPPATVDAEVERIAGQVVGHERILHSREINDNDKVIDAAACLLVEVKTLLRKLRQPPAKAATVTEVDVRKAMCNAGAHVACEYPTCTCHGDFKERMDRYTKAIMSLLQKREA